ncbi:MAG: hypothetical protein HUK01_07165 [Bacteroidaceae bacterium]|nr:hypothetical protein [Bacteroidaceae bacterium]
MTMSRTMKASEGMKLFNGFVYADEVSLAVNDSPSNWREVPASQYEEYLRGLEKEGEEEM